MTKVLLWTGTAASGVLFVDVCFQTLPTRIALFLVLLTMGAAVLAAAFLPRWKEVRIRVPFAVNRDGRRRVR
jgi:hypothetical protein